MTAFTTADVGIRLRSIAQEQSDRPGTAFRANALSSRLLGAQNGVRSFGLQAEPDRRSGNFVRCGSIVLEDLQRLAEGGCRDISLTKHDSRAHEEGPSFDVSRPTLIVG